MAGGIRSFAQAVGIAAMLAVAGFGAAGYGVFGAVPATNAILETTAQLPMSILPRPSPDVDAGGAIPPNRPSTTTPVPSLILIALIGLSVIAIWRRIGNAGKRRQPGGDST